MIQPTPWFKREFPFDLSTEMYPPLVERLRGTPARLEDRLGGLSEATLTGRETGKWSIKENAGHLSDVEPLWSGRVDDLLAHRQALRPADLENLKTHEANHNATPVETLLMSFREARSGLVTRLETLDEASITLAALHPRLGQPMRLLDLVFFIAEHDDHHMARITELVRRFAGA